MDGQKLRLAVARFSRVVPTFESWFLIAPRYRVTQGCNGLPDMFGSQSLKSYSGCPKLRDLPLSTLED